MAAAGIKLHPACRVRQEGFGLLFYDLRGPRLLFAETGNLLAPEHFEAMRSKEDLPKGLTEEQARMLQNFITKLLKRGFLREQ
jgi:putative mycofactocin binding protein MftB